MKYKLILFLTVFLMGVDGVYSQQRVKLKNALDQITKVYGTKFSYADGLLDHEETMSNLIPVKKEKPIEEVLKTVLYPNRLLFLYVQDNYYTIIRERKTDTDTEPRAVQDPYLRTITGIVKDEMGRPVVGASVIPQGLRQGTLTSSDGRYTIRMKTLVDALIFSYLGMQPKRVLIGNSDEINIVLQLEDNVIEEVSVVSTGYQKVPKDRATGAFGQVSSAEIRKTPTISLTDRLEGTMAGVHVDPKTHEVQIRGVNSYGAGSSKRPLIVVDGFQMSDIENNRFNLGENVTGQASGGAILSMFNPEDIESITVLKDAAAASIWGANAANGVIVIETKKGRSGQPTIGFGTNFSVSKPSDLSKLDRMNSAQYVALEKELFEKGFYADNYTADSWTPFNTKKPHSQAVEWLFSRQRGQATQTQLDSALSSLSLIDNNRQIQDYLLQTATSQQYNLSVSGGSGGTNYFLSGNYSKDVPSFRANRGESAFVNANLTNTLFNNRVRVSTGINYNFNDALNNPTAMNAFSGLQYGLRPYDLLVDDNGERIRRYLRYRPEVIRDRFDKAGYLDWTYNTLDELDAIQYAEQANRLRINMDVNTKITDWLDFSVMGQYQRNLENTENISSLDSYEVRDAVNYATAVVANGRLSYGIPLGGKLGTRSYNGWQYVLRSQFNINKDFGTDQHHNLTFIAGTEVSQNEYRSVSQNFFGFNPDTYGVSAVNPTVQYPVVEGWNESIGTQAAAVVGRNLYRSLSYYANAATAFLNGRYVISGSVRFDDFTVVGASRSQRAQPLWSIGGKWNLKKEEFMRDVSWLDNLDLRLTYGVNGTIPNGVGNVTVITTSTDAQTNETTAKISSPANQQVTWEKVYGWNYGIDLTTWSKRLTFSADYYNKRTEDILYNLPFNPTYGWTQLMFNSASMKARGIDIALGVDWFRDRFGGKTTFTFGYNTNEVTDTRFTKATNAATLTTSRLPIAGMPVDYLYAYRWAGLDESGRSQVSKLDGSIVKASQSGLDIAVDDLVYMGRTTPPYIGGLFNTFRYKNFTLDVRMTYEMGHILRRSSIQNYPSFSISANSTAVIGTQKDLAYRWQQDGDQAITNVPAIVQDGSQSNSLTRYSNADILVVSGSHIRFQQVGLGYNFNADILRRLPFKTLSINTSARNLGILWRENKDGVDPKYRYVGNYSNIPPAPTYFLSISTTF